MSANAERNISSLIQGCIRKERHSQELLYKQFYGYALSICFRYARDHDEAVAILNDGFLKIFTNIKNHNQEKSFKAWLRKIMINTALDHYRKQARQPYMDDLEMVKQMPYGSDIINNLTYEEILQLIQFLPTAYRAVFNLYVIDGYNHEEIAEMLDISSGTSKSNLAKARMHLRKLLQKYYNEEQTRYSG